MNIETSQLKKMSTDDQVVKLVGGVLAMKAKTELTRERVDAYIATIFGSYEFYEAKKWSERREKRSGKPESPKRITDIKHLYLSDMDSEQYREFRSRCNEAHRSGPFAQVMIEQDLKHPLRDLEQNFWCPALIAESEERTIRNDFAKYIATEWLGMDDGKIAYPFSDKLVDIVVSLVLSGPRRAVVNSGKVLADFAS